MTGRVRVALVGAGGWGRQHARVLAAHPNVDFTAVCGRTPERTAARAAEFGVRPYTSLPRMLENEVPDLVCVCLPNEEHFDVTLELIHAGVPLFVEKPLVFDLVEAEELISEAEERGLFYAINFNHRYATPVQMAREAVQTGTLGDVTFATWRFGGEPGNSRRPYANLIETQCHGFDMLEHLCGPIDSVMAQMNNSQVTGNQMSDEQALGADLRDTAVVALRFTSGAVGTLVGTYDSSYAYPGTHQLEVNGTRGRVLVEDTVRRYTLSLVGEETSQVWQAGYFNDAGRDFHATVDQHLDAVLRAFADGAAPPVPATAGLRALQLAHAAIESHETGRRVHLASRHPNRPAWSSSAAARPHHTPTRTTT